MQAQLKLFLDEHKPKEVFQLGFKMMNSTESAWLRVFIVPPGYCHWGLCVPCSAVCDMLDHNTVFCWFLYSTLSGLVGLNRILQAGICVRMGCSESQCAPLSYWCFTGFYFGGHSLLVWFAAPGFHHKNGWYFHSTAMLCYLDVKHKWISKCHRKCFGAY